MIGALPLQISLIVLGVKSVRRARSRCDHPFISRYSSTMVPGCGTVPGRRRTWFPYSCVSLIATISIAVMHFHLACSSDLSGPDQFYRPKENLKG